MAQSTETATIETNLGDIDLQFVNDAQINQLWGDITSQIGQEGAMGDHSSAQGAFTPDPFAPDGTADPSISDPARDGVGNSTMDNPNFLPDDAEAGTGE